MKNLIQNISAFSILPEEGKELFHVLLQEKNIKIELITSNKSSDLASYTQAHDEWVFLLEGKAIIEIRENEYALKKGDYLFIKANTPHRVITTDEKCLWLAVHIY